MTCTRCVGPLSQPPVGSSAITTSLAIYNSQRWKADLRRTPQIHSRAILLHLPAMENRRAERGEFYGDSVSASVMVAALQDEQRVVRYTVDEAML